MTALIHNKNTEVIDAIPCTRVAQTDEVVILEIEDRVVILPNEKYRLVGTTY